MRCLSVALVCCLSCTTAISQEQDKPLQLKEAEAKEFKKLENWQQVYVNLVIQKPFSTLKLEELTWQTERLRKGMIGYAPQHEMYVNQIVDDHSALIFGHSIWLDNVNTEALTEGSTIWLPKNMVVYVAGNKTYKTVLGGTKTSKQLIAINPEGLGAAKKFLDFYAKNRELNRWVVNGTDIVAKLVRRSGSKVRVEYSNGEQASIPFKSFDDETKAWLRKQ